MGLGFGVWVAILSWVRRGTEIRGFCSFSLGFSMVLVVLHPRPEMQAERQWS